MKKYILRIVLIVITLMSISIYSDAASNTTIELVPSTNSIVPNKNISIEVKVKNQTLGISAFNCFINYDEKVFEKITKDDISTTIPEDNIDTFSYNENTKKLILTFSDSIDNIESLITINLKSKEGIDNTITNSNIYLGKIELYNLDNDIYLIDCEDSVPVQFNVANEALNLSSQIYKIGDEDINNYQEGDKYISRVSPNTTIENFINNLETNGTITINNLDGTEVTNIEDLVKTGMTIKVTKEGNTDINLTIILTGDVNSDGIVDITDLVKVRQQIQQLFDIDEKVTRFDEKQNKAGDINEDLFIDITDLVKIRRYIQEMDIL